MHDLGGDPSAPPVLFSHATGFHGRAYQALADALADRYHCVAFDHRGHGATAAPLEWEAGRGVDWARYGDDAEAAALAVAPDGGLVGFGHSMGAATLLLTASRRPAQFGRLVLFEPITGRFADSVDPETCPLVVGARRRRRRFASVDEAYANFASKRPLDVMTPASLRAYVEHGLRTTADGDVELCCSPEVEAATFAASPSNGVWDLLPQIEVPTLIVAGHVEPTQPSSMAAAVADRLPNAELVVFDDQTHFGPFSHPHEVAALL
jgi:pimeloyl-ACP methyl ester carboxylesterase